DLARRRRADGRARRRDRQSCRRRDRPRSRGRHRDSRRHAQRRAGGARIAPPGDEERARTAMMLRVVLRSLATRPLRTAVLAFGFGLAVAVMAELLGVGEVILEQAHSPALRGGGDVVIGGTFGSVDNARFILSNVMGSEPLRSRVAAASPSRRGNLYLITSHDRVPVTVRAGVPTLEKAVGDPEVADMRVWVDAPGDTRWSAPDQADILRAMDRFHPVPPAP